MVDHKQKWQVSTGPLTLEAGEAHLWRARIPKVPEEKFPFWDILSKEEQKRVERFIFLKDKLQFAFSRGLLKKLLASYLKIVPEKLSFQYQSHGKPYLAEGPVFNLSHSKGVVVIMVAREGEVGVDVEGIDNKSEDEKLVQRYFSEAEIDFYKGYPPEERRRVFFKLWTLKEAFIKAKGKGMSYGLKDFSVQWDSQESVSLTLPKNEGHQPWYSQLFQPYPEYQGAWLFGGEAPVLQCLDGNAWLNSF